MKKPRSPRRPRLPAPPGSNRLLNLAEVGGVLGVSIRTLMTWRASGKLRVLCLTPRSLRVEQAEVDRLIEEARR
jgi:predicted site-specific integrase-resolvase